MGKSSKSFGSKLHGRSKITNGTRLLPSIDGRSVWARRLRDLIALHENDYGGSNAISEAERSLIRRASALTVELELLETKFAANGGAQIEELDRYQRAANSLRRLLETLGLQRRAKDVTPSLDQYLRQRNAEPVEAAE
jgi:hypothetical protein